MPRQNPHWLDNELQFARLIAESEGLGLLHADAKLPNLLTTLAVRRDVVVADAQDKRLLLRLPDALGHGISDSGAGGERYPLDLLHSLELRNDLDGMLIDFTNLLGKRLKNLVCDLRILRVETEYGLAAIGVESLFESHRFLLQKRKKPRHCAGAD